MTRVAFTMQLLPGFESEYKRRHDEIWPELKQLLSSSGISNYSIFLDESTGTLFASMEVSNEPVSSQNRHNPIMKKWWHYMGDIMKTNADESPVTKPLKEVFHLP